MKEKIQTSGLCTNCSNADDCNYSVNHTKPIIFCEEFTCTDPSLSKNTIDGTIKWVNYPKGPMPKGLCSNCDYIDACNLNGTDDNLNTCEEYR